MNAQLKEVREEMFQMQKGFKTALESPFAIPEDKERLRVKIGLLDELLRFVDTRPEEQPRKAPEGCILKESLVAYLKPKIEQTQRVVLVYVQDKCFEGGKLKAYKEILEDVKKM